ncbi:class I SAM-dependent methyltransferase [Legionella worsleiensis]|uniref:Putative methyltransferase n=1 Tax=Legionella worsleiensis TaxID=45076 RepID=A0A0W1AJN4_9GAMM|nr:class I SAM-dependent methyltransferase [Legionella worsleiensis]KTD81490.1 putative methyltransferase [Legionella worsleiensis]STY32049.1 Putative methyltransferase [Legionella worsleiensis]
MSQSDWPAHDYAVGSYIQALVADQYLPHLNLAPTDNVLDVGCGNGAYSRKILKKVPQGSVLGVDPSENMLKLAQEVTAEYPNFAIKKDNVTSMNFKEQFDFVVSFWCLQWTTDIFKSFENIINALKKGGTFFTLFPSGDDPFIKSYYALRDSGRYSALSDFKPPINYSQLINLNQQLEPLKCSKLNIELLQQTLVLPELDVFRKFVNGIAFYQGQLAETEIKELNEAMVQYFDAECRNLYQGEYQFNFAIYCVSGEK